MQIILCTKGKTIHPAFFPLTTDFWVVHNTLHKREDNTIKQQIQTSGTLQGKVLSYIFKILIHIKRVPEHCLFLLFIKFVTIHFTQLPHSCAVFSKWEFWHLFMKYMTIIKIWLDLIWLTTPQYSKDIMLKITTLDLGGRPKSYGRRLSFWESSIRCH